MKRQDKLTLLICLSILFVLVALVLCVSCNNVEKDFNGMEYEVKFELNGGTVALPEARIYKYGETIELPSQEPFKNNCVFLGWYNGAKKWSDKDVVKSDITLSVKWDEAETACYLVKHFKQKDTSYDLVCTETLDGPIGGYTCARAKLYDGYHKIAFEQLKIAADGSTVVNIKYELSNLKFESKKLSRPSDLQEINAGLTKDEFYVYTKQAGLSANNDDSECFFIENSGFEYQTISFDFYFESMNEGMQNSKPYMSIKNYYDSNMANYIQDGRILGVEIKDKFSNVGIEYVSPNGKEYTWANVELNTWYTITIKNAKEFQRIQNVLWVDCEAVMYVANLCGEKGSDCLFSEQSIIAKSYENIGYYAWPSVAKIGDGKLMAVCSQRQAHVDPYGKVVGIISDDNGKSWGEPFVIIDGILDDRDAGITYWNGKIFVTTFTQTKELYTTSGNLEWSIYSCQISDKEYNEAFGSWYAVSLDNGVSWSDKIKCPIFSPHGMIVTPDNNLAYVGYAQFDNSSGSWLSERSYIGISFSKDGITWSSPKTILSANERMKKDFHEPNAIYNDAGDLIVVLRTAEGMFQTESFNNGDTWSDLRKICDAADTPPHLLKLDDGTLVLTYGYRVSPIGVRALFSYDGGKNWVNETIITADGIDWDMGYPCSIVLNETEMLTVYYQKEFSCDPNVSLMQVKWCLPKKNDNAIIKFDSKGGSFVESIVGVCGETISEPEEPIKEDNVFIGWFLDFDCTIPYCFGVVTSNVTLYAGWSSKHPIPNCSSTYLREATQKELFDSGYKGTNNAWFYTKGKGVQAGPGKTPAQLIFSVDKEKYNTISFRIYVVSHTATHLQISNMVDSRDFDFKILKDSTGNEETIVQGWGSNTITTGEWYTITVDMTNISNVILVIWANSAAELIIADVVATNN